MKFWSKSEHVTWSADDDFACQQQFINIYQIFNFPKAILTSNFDSPVHTVRLPWPTVPWPILSFQALFNNFNLFMELRMRRISGRVAHWTTVQYAD